MRWLVIIALLEQAASRPPVRAALQDRVSATSGQ
jgi:hypothetical protein